MGAEISGFLRREHGQLVGDLQALVRIPSVSGDPLRAADVRRCAESLARMLRDRGAAGVRLLTTATHPMVVGEWRTGIDGPTVLIYGHYDVQPPGPLGPWGYPPFGATIVGTKLVGRGAADDKGQFFAHLAAVDALRRRPVGLPVDVVVMLDGAEEIGAPSLASILTRSGPWSTADVAVVSDDHMVDRLRPALTVGMRGLVGLDVDVERAGPPAHAGHLGGAVPDPLAALAGVLAELHDDEGCVSVPGFYDTVRAADASAGPGLDGPATRPALTVTGLAGGGVGRRASATIGSRARASLDIRLVPDQEPLSIATAVANRLRDEAPPGVRVRVRLRSAVRPVEIDVDHTMTRLAGSALADGFGTRPKTVHSGGSNPAVAALVEAGLPVVLMGFSLPDDQIHGPNERLDLPTFFRAIVASASFLERLGRAGGGAAP